MDDLDKMDPNYRYVIVSKTNANTPISTENMRDLIHMTQLKKTPILSLYESLHSVYAPVLLKQVSE
jgi:dynein heavy chain 2